MKRQLFSRPLRIMLLLSVLAICNKQSAFGKRLNIPAADMLFVPAPEPPAPPCASTASEYQILFSYDNLLCINPATGESPDFTLPAFIKNFKDNFKYGPKKTDATAGIALVYKDEPTTVGELSRIQQDISLTGLTAGTYITALQISFGIIVNEKRLILIYEPGCLKKKSGMSDKFDFVPAGKNYILNGGVFTEIANAKTLKSDYIDHIYFPHKKGTNYFHDYDSWAGDVKSVMVPYQEIWGIYCENETLPNVAHVITFINLASKLDPSSGAENLKHHIAIQYKEFPNDCPNPDPKDMSKIFVKFSASDFAEMCPPRCNPSQYPIAGTKSKVKKRNPKYPKF